MPSAPHLPCRRDIKPQNLLVNINTHALKLCDFGSAKTLVRGEPNISYICSRYYRAPELIFGATDYTCAIDVRAPAGLHACDCLPGCVCAVVPAAGHDSCFATCGMVGRFEAAASASCNQLPAAWRAIPQVWSVGCVMAELLLGSPLFPGESGVDQLVEIIKVS